MLSFFFCNRNVTSALMERIHRAEMELRNVVGNTTQLQKLSLARCVSLLITMTLSYSGQFNKRKFSKWLIIQYYPQNLEKHTLDLFLTIQKFIIKR